MSRGLNWKAGTFSCTRCGTRYRPQAESAQAWLREHQERPVCRAREVGHRLYDFGWEVINRRYEHLLGVAGIPYAFADTALTQVQHIDPAKDWVVQTVEDRMWAPRGVEVIIVECHRPGRAPTRKGHFEEMPTRAAELAKRYVAKVLRRRSHFPALVTAAEMGGNPAWRAAYQAIVRLPEDAEFNGPMGYPEGAFTLLGEEEGQVWIPLFPEKGYSTEYRIRDTRPPPRPMKSLKKRRGR